MRVLALLVLIPLACAETPAAVGPVAYWCADRDGDRVHGLDGRLHVARSIAVARPVFLEPGPEDTVWVVSAPRGPGSPHEILRVDPGGGSKALRPIGAVVGAAAESGRLWILERRLRDVVLASVSPTNRLRRRVSVPSAVCLGAAPGRVAVGVRDERLLIFGTGASASSPAPVALHRLPGSPRDLRPGPTGAWWVALENRPRLLLVDEGAGIRWSRPAPGRDLLLGGGGDRVEVLDALRGHRVAFDLAGRRTERQRLPLRGLAVGLRAAGHQRLFCCPGALYWIDDGTGLESTQGGFEFLVDAIAVP